MRQRVIATLAAARPTRVTCLLRAYRPPTAFSIGDLKLLAGVVYYPWNRISKTRLATE